MAFDLITNFGEQGDGYGDGSSGALTLTAKNTIINAYAKVTNINGKTITIDNVTNAAAFKVGALVLVQCVGRTNSAETFQYIGHWRTARITAVDGFNITLKKSFNSLAWGSSKAIFQAIVVPQYSSVTLPANTSITCPQFNSTTGTGGVVAFLCSGDLTFDGGHINLGGKGYQTASDRPLHPFESDRSWTGFENYKKKGYLPINYPDGAAFIVAQKMTCHEDSRIGNVDSYGTARVALSADSTKHGGSNIMLAAGTISSFEPKMISKTPSVASGRGWPGCYIATGTCLPCDEGLYAYDRISDENRVRDIFKIKNYGTGAHGSPDAKQIVKQLNSYAAISTIDKTRKIFTITNRDDNGIAKFEAGALVMIRADRKESGNHQYVGRFIITKILAIESPNKVYVETAFPNLTNVNTTKYNFQMVAIPQFADFTLAKTNSATPKYENGRGGIVAIAVSGTCDLSGGQLLVEGKGGCPAGNTKGLNFISNAQMAEKLPIGKGNGSVFILANNLVMNSDTRIGASWTGDAFGGAPDGVITGYGLLSGTQFPNAVSGAFMPGAIRSYKILNGAGSQGGAVEAPNGLTYHGGFNCNGYIENEDGTTSPTSYQGAHVLIVANKITGLNPAAISTGGQGGGAIYNSGAHKLQEARNGGCGYGGGGGYLTDKISGTWIVNYESAGGNGGYLGGGGGNYTVYGKSSADVNYAYCFGGGSGAFCFIYCNKYENQDYTNVWSW